MRPSFSPRRVTVDRATGTQRFDDEVVPPRRSFGTPSSLSSPSLSSVHMPSKETMYLHGAVQAIVCGMIIAIVLCPCMIGFSTIIYSHPEFEPVMPLLIKIVFVSSVVHQLVILYLSPLSYAIGQVQDAGLIFLSSIAASIMVELGHHVPMDERIATVVVALSISTAIVGAGLIVIGKLRLASLVQYLPTPVIGGYLAYIGFFMIKGGISLMTGAHLTGLASWGKLMEGQMLTLAMPGIVSGILLALITTRFHHFAVFPCCLVLMPIVFFLLLTISGTSIDDARAIGFLATEGPSISLSHVYGLFDFSKVHWYVMPAQIPTVISMFLVISFASSLDIAAICMGTESTMNYNEQLQTVGTSNLISGLTGGYTGSYIFSQTMFSYRFHPSEVEELKPGFSRIVGLTLAACELGIVLIPHSLMTVVPKFLFGSVMIFIGIELLKAWLFGVYLKLLFQEYVTVVCTFVFLNAFGVQVGLACGVALAAFCFLIEYSKSQVVRVVQKTSNVIRNAEQHELLHAHTTGQDGLMRKQPIVTIELQGHIFFGSATRIQTCVKRAVYVQPLELLSRRNSLSNEECLPLLASSRVSRVFPTTSRLQNLEGEPCEPTDQERGPTRFVVFDFSQVTGMDATAARSCFLALKLLFRQQQITVVYCGMQQEVEFLLRANDVILSEESDSHVTSDLDLALDWCEQQLILSAATTRNHKSSDAHVLEPPTLSLPQVFAAYLPNKKKDDAMKALEELALHFHVRQWKDQDVLFRVGEDSDTWYVLLSGQVTLYTTSSSVDMVGAQTPRKKDTTHKQKKMELVGRVRPGCIFGDLDFVLHQKRVMDAKCTSAHGVCVTASIGRKDVEHLAQTRLDLAYLLQEIVLRASYMTIAEKLHSIVV